MQNHWLFWLFLTIFIYGSEVPENLMQPVQLAGFVSRRSPRGNREPRTPLLTNPPTASPLAIFASLPKQEYSYAKPRQLSRQNLMRVKKVKLAELNSAHRRSQVNCLLFTNQLVYIKRIKLFLFAPHDKHLINRGQSVCMRESSVTLLVLTSQRSVYIHDLAQTSPIQTSCSITKK